MKHLIKNMLKTKHFRIDFINASYRRFFQQHKKEIMKAFERCASKGDFMLRDETRKFEKNLAKFVGTKYAVGVNSGTDALFLSLKALGINENHNVITVGHTFIASLQAVTHCGATIHLVDVGEDGLIDVSQIEKWISSDTKAILPVHLSGKVCDMQQIMSIAKTYNLFVIEDACQALGAKIEMGISNWRIAGSIGDTGCFSFNFPKLMGAYGDAGAITTNNEELYKKLLLLRNHWNITQGSVRQDDYPQPEIMGWGWKSRIDNIQAAILNVKFRYLKKMLKRRREIAMRYNKELKELPLKLPIQQEKQVYQEYIIRINNQKEFVNYMQKRGIELLVRDTIPNHQLVGLNLSHFELPITEKMAKENVRLPIYPELTNVEIDTIIKAIKSFYGRS